MDLKDLITTDPPDDERDPSAWIAWAKSRMLGLIEERDAEKKNAQEHWSKMELAERSLRHLESWMQARQKMGVFTHNVGERVIVKGMGKAAIFEVVVSASGVRYGLEWMSPNGVVRTHCSDEYFDLADVVEMGKDRAG